MREKWQGIKDEKRQLQPSYTKLKDVKGQRVKYGQEAQAKAEYLGEVQWKQKEKADPKRNPRKIISKDLQIRTEEITIKELRKTIRKLKNNKTPGTDRVTVDMIKALDKQNLEILRGQLNECWTNECIPEIMTEANVASLFKKGDTQNLANYRPIALLNYTYRILASIIQQRLAEKLDQHIHPTQYGFRAKRSTSQASFLARRIQDISEQSGDKLLLVLLDWEKAFDKIRRPL